jgi:hypothetical protein
MLDRQHKKGFGKKSFFLLVAADAISNSPANLFWLWKLWGRCHVTLNSIKRQKGFAPTEEKAEVVSQIEEIGGRKM